MNAIVNVFWDRRYRRLRMVGRVIIFLVVYLFALGLATFPAVTAVMIVLMAAGQLTPEQMSDPNVVNQLVIENAWTGAAVGLGTMLATFVVMWLVGWAIDRRKFRDFGMQFDANWWLDLGFGLALGAVLMALIFGVEWLLGWITIDGLLVAQGGNFWLQVGARLLLFIGVGFYEEMLFRGYLLKNLTEGLNFIGARAAIIVTVVVTSLLFGLAHASNPNANLVSTVNIMLAGILLGMGMFMTGSLAIPIGLHITWNFFQGVVFGFPVSGTSNPASFVAITQGGNDLVTGGAFGPEAGIIGIVAMLLGIGLTVGYVWLRYRALDLHLALATPELRRPRAADETPAPAPATTGDTTG